MTSALALRVVPPAMFGRRSHRLVERNLLVYRRTWLIWVSGFFEPVFYLFSLGIGLDDLVGTVAGPGGEPISYRAFVAPALLAASAMNGAIYESTMNVFYKLKYGRVYDAMLATPMGVGDVALGEITFCLMRGALYGTGFLAVMAGMGLIESAWAVLALPAALLIGFAFAATGMAFTSFVRDWSDFEAINVSLMLLFLFSATFYPLATYPGWLQTVVRVSPLYQGVELIRSLTTGNVELALLLHALYLVAMGLLGLAVASRRLSRLLLP